MANNIDLQVDETLENCIMNSPRKSFFLFAGAGSGKTYSLVLLLKKIRDNIGKDLMLQGKNVAVITFTNAATDEIVNRLDYSPVFHISTIHSFVWDVIKYYQSDIKKLYCLYIQEDIQELNGKLESAKSKTTKTYLANSEKLERLKERLGKAKFIKKFIYSPNGGNLEYNALKHAEVIKISSQLILESDMLQRIIAQRYPILLIDESQDTNKELVDAFFKIQENFGQIFTLGLIGDLKQRIYLDGKVNMINSIPTRWKWEKLEKKMNYRSAKRIIQLANAISKDLDEHTEQISKEDAMEGLIRLFVIQQHEGIDKDEVEQVVIKKMSYLTGDKKWHEIEADVKILTLEHLMAVRRMGFDKFFEPLSKVTKYQMTFMQGSVSEIEFFTKEIIPIADSMNNDGREALEILKANSPLLSKEVTDKPYELYLRCREETNNVTKLVTENHTIREVVKSVLNSKLLIVPDVVREASGLKDVYTDMDEDLSAWIKVMDLPISMVREYDDYVNHRTRFDTHQGVKGLEFDRVMVIIDDSEANGSMFSYDKLFGAKDLSETDIRNKAEGKETTIERTQRLFYVTCTRAKNSLAVVMYTNNPEKVKTEAMKKQWFVEEEIEIMYSSVI